MKTPSKAKWTKPKPKRDPNKYPRGWNRKSIQELADYYDNQTDDEAIAEAEAAYNDPKQTVMFVPWELVPKVHKLLDAYYARERRAQAGPSRRRRVREHQTIGLKKLSRRAVS